MSDIYLAKTVGIGGFQKPLIIKKLFPEYVDKSRYVKRFMNEAKTLALLNHVNIVQVLDIGVIDGEYYIAMEYIEGRNAAHMLSRAKNKQSPPALEFCLYVILEIAKGLAYAHRKRDPRGDNLMLVHQDINSFNVMISYEAEVKIIDFGIARIFLDEPARQGVPVTGKLLYFSPEQLRGGPVDRRVDIYGTGVLLYELLTGQRLIQHQPTLEKTVRTILAMDIQEKIGVNDRIHDQLKPILIKSIALNPEDRYFWMEEMIADIRSVISKLGLDLDPSACAAYMQSLFNREMGLDRQRMRMLMSLIPEAEQPRQPPLSVEAAEAGAFHNVSGAQDSQPDTMNQAGSAPALFAAKTIKIGSGQTIFQQGDLGTNIYIIQSGSVGLFIKAGQARKKLAVLAQGDILGEAGLVDEGGRCAYAVALEDCTLVSIDKDAFLELIPQDAFRKIIIRLAERLRDATVFLAGARLEDPLFRLVYALLFFHRRNSAHAVQEVDLVDLSDLFGLEDRDRLNRYLGKLETLQIVEVNQETVRIKDIEKLKNIVKLLTGGGQFTMKL
jgi:serine/threonine-protein kinase